MAVLARMLVIDRACPQYLFASSNHAFLSMLQYSDERTFTTERLQYHLDKHDITSCQRTDMFDGDTCTVTCVPGYEVNNNTYLCDSTRQIEMVDVLY